MNSRALLKITLGLFFSLAFLIFLLPGRTNTSYAAAVRDDDPTATPTPSVTPTSTPVVTLRWFSDFETGDLTQWSAAGGEFLEQNNGSYSIVTTPSPVYDQTYSAGLTIDTSEDSIDNGDAAYLFLYDDFLEEEDYYSAYYYIPSGFEFTQNYSWLSIWQWKSTYNGDTDDSVMTFSIGVEETNDGLRLVLYQRLCADETETYNRTYKQTIAYVPTDEWFQIKAYYKRANDGTGEVWIWQKDRTTDRLIYKVKDANTTFADGTLYWSINNYANDVEPDPFTIYVDDVRIENGPLPQATASSDPVIIVPESVTCPTLPVPPGIPTTSSPTGTYTTSNKMTYTWTAESTATKYELNVLYSDGATMFSTEYTPAEAGCSGGTGNCTLADNTALDNDDYSWQVRAYNSGGWGSFSTERSFSVRLANAPILVSPTGAIEATTPTYTWEAVPGATQYRFWIVDSAEEGVLDTNYTISQAGCSSGTGNCAVTPAMTLSPGTYYWGLRTYTDAWGGWSDTGTFTIASDVPDAPTTSSPTGTYTTSNKMTYIWTADSTATKYELDVQYSDGSTMFSAEYTPAEAGCSGGTGNCTLAEPTAMDNGDYLWQVRTYNTEVWGPYSTARSFSVRLANAPILVSPTGTIGTTTPTYTWGAVSDATQYRFLIANSAEEEIFDTVYTISQAGCSSGTGNCAVTPAMTLIPGTYYWVLRTYTDAWGGWSDTGTFTVSTGG